MSRPNVFDADFSGGYDETDPDGYRAIEVPIGKLAGGDEWIFRDADGHVGYYDGEPLPES